MSDLLDRWKIFLAFYLKDRVYIYIYKYVLFSYMGVCFKKIQIMFLLLTPQPVFSIADNLQLS